MWSRVVKLNCNWFRVAVVNECELFPELCLYGKCIDTRTSYRCECPLGYTLGPRGVMCKGKYVRYHKLQNFSLELENLKSPQLKPLQGLIWTVCIGKTITCDQALPISPPTPPPPPPKKKRLIAGRSPSPGASNSHVFVQRRFYKLDYF